MNDTKDQFQIHRDTFLESCKIEVGLLNVADSIKHVVNNLDENGFDSGVISALLAGSVALLQQQITSLTKMRIPHLNAIPNHPCDDGPCETCEHASACNGSEEPLILEAVSLINSMPSTDREAAIEYLKQTIAERRELKLAA